MAANVYTIERIVHNSVTYGGAVNWDVTPELEELIADQASVLYPSLRALTGLQWTMSVTTVDVGTALTAMFPSGRYVPHVPINEATGTCVVYMKRKLAAAADGGTLKHIKLTINRGMIVPRTLGPGPSGVAQLTLDITADFDGTNLPVVVATGQSLPSGTATAAALHVVRSIKNGSAGLVFHQLQNPSLDFGIATERERTANCIYPTATTITANKPSLTWEAGDLKSVLGLIFAAGSAVATGGLTLYLGSVTGVGVAAASALGLVFRGTVTPDDFSVVWPTTISWSRGVVRCACQARGIGGDTLATPPLTLSTGLTLPVESGDPPRYVFGAAIENSTEYEVSGGSIEFGMDWQSPDVLTLPHDNQITLMKLVRKISIQTPDTEFVTGLGVGRAISTNFKLWFQLLTAEGERIKRVTPSHMGLKFTAGDIAPGKIGGASGGLAVPEFVVTPLGDVATLNTDAAIA